MYTTELPASLMYFDDNGIKRVARERSPFLERTSAINTRLNHVIFRELNRNSSRQRFYSSLIY